jgi:hypothetical protein
MHPTPEPSARALTICSVVLVSLACCVCATGATLADYRHRVAEAIALVGQLQGAYDDEDPSQRARFANTNVDRIREVLPAKETIAINARSVVVDNTWLHEALKNYEKTNADQRAETLARIDERLRALDERLEEVMSGKPSASDQDRDKGKLAEILRRSDYNKPVDAEGSALGRLWDRFMNWLSRLFRAPKAAPRASSSFISGLAQIVIVVVCLAGIAFLIWKVAPRYLNRRRGKKKQKREARIVLGERLEPDQTSADLLAQAELLARNGDLRAAIRKAYIALLCELGDRKIVSLAQHKTNRDYLNSVRERTRLYNFMRQLTGSFELHWYGFQPAVESDWIEFRSVYQQVLKTDSGR